MHFGAKGANLNVYVCSVSSFITKILKLFFCFFITVQLYLFIYFLKTLMSKAENLNRIVNSEPLEF